MYAGHGHGASAWGRVADNPTGLDAINPGEHLDVETIVDRARTELGSVSTQAVYDALHTLDSAGLVRRIEPAGGPALFEARREGPATTLPTRKRLAAALAASR